MRPAFVAAGSVAPQHRMTMTTEEMKQRFDAYWATHKPVGVYNTDGWTFNAGNTNPNYNSTSGTITDTITVRPLDITANNVPSK